VRSRFAVDFRGARWSDRETRRAVVRLEATHFGALVGGFRSKGGIEARLSDCTFGPGAPVASVEDANAASSSEADLVVTHISVLAGQNPVFRFHNATVRVTFERNIVGGVAREPSTLIQADDKSQLSWRGRANLYAHLGPYFQPFGEQPTAPVVRSLDSWADLLGQAREVGSRQVDGRLWALDDPEQALAQADPMAAFAPFATGLAVRDAGVRRGPHSLVSWSSKTGTSLVDPSRTGESRLDIALGGRSRVNSRSEPNSTGRDEVPPSQGDRPPKPAELTSSSGAESSSTSTQVPPMSLAPMGRADDPLSASPMPLDPSRPDAVSPPPFAPMPNATDGNTSPRNGTLAPAGVQVVRNREELLAAIERIGPAGGTIEFQNPDEIELPGTVLRGTGRWVFRAAEGLGLRSRPRLRFRPLEGDPGGSRVTCVKLEGGSLEIQGLDLLLPRRTALRESRTALFTLVRGSELLLDQVTVTLEGDAPGSSLVAVESEAPRGFEPQNANSARVRVSDSILRSGGDGIDVATATRLDFEATNSILATAGALIRGHGTSRAQSPSPITASLRQTIARVQGGLVALDSTIDTPVLPITELQVRESILATTSKGDPLFRIENQDDLESGRDIVRWEGHKVFYHRIETYRRDQNAQPGSMAVRLDRPLWEVAVGPQEEAALHGDATFSLDWRETRPIWSFGREDAELADLSPAKGLGADLRQIPLPPPVSSP
jgi:serine/threonine-protein kinase